jgi:DNA-binding SARP family transcriptional activator
MAKLNINLLGRIEFQYGGKPLEHKLSNKGIALISLLMLDMGKEMGRDKLISYLWADSDEEAARYNLRYNLWNIKKLIPADEKDQEFILSSKDCCRINSRYDLDSDILLLKAFSGNGERKLEDLNTCKELFRGDFLEGIYLKNCDEFNEKIILERIIYQNKYVDLLNEIAEKYEICKNYKECLRILNELTGIEPYNEKLIGMQIGAYSNLGKVQEAIQCYKKFELSLRSNLNLSPGEELKLLYRKLQEQPREEGRTASGAGDSRLRKQDIVIEVDSIENIEYFSISDMIRKILQKGDRKYIFGFHKCYLEDLNVIQLEIGLGYEKLYNDKCTLHSSLPDVRAADAFIKFIRYISEIYTIKIHIANPAQMDPVSRSIMLHIKQLQIKDLLITNI